MIFENSPIANSSIPQPRYLLIRYFAWCKVLRSNITFNRDKYYKVYNFVRAKKISGVWQYGKAKFAAALTEVDL